MKENNFLKKIKRTKKNGALSLTAPTLLLTVGFLILLGLSMWRLSLLKDSRDDISTAMASANLAVMCPDAQILGRDGITTIPIDSRSYQIYKDCLMKSLNLDSNLVPNNLSENSTVEDYHIKRLIIYNVVDDNVTATEIQSNGSAVQISSGNVGTVMTPNNMKVSKSGVYSELSCTTKLFKGEKVERTLQRFSDVRVIE